MIRHLLVAHDLTPEADVALARAAQLARQHDARVSLLHVYDPGYRRRR
ncbi:universal stress protein [Pseudomonas aeruginosa]|nr:universal stress protein [Pseudomonas aeruginosa]MDF5938316.1 universal stress protein [Pseudomonas aeruginosa]